MTFSTSIYIMCVCLFSALSRRIGALQIVIIMNTGRNRKQQHASAGTLGGKGTLLVGRQVVLIAPRMSVDILGTS